MRPMIQRTNADQQVPTNVAMQTTNAVKSGHAPARAWAWAAESVPLWDLAEEPVGEYPSCREIIVKRQASKVGMRQFARLGGEAMTSSKTSVGETKMLTSFSRTEVAETDEAGIELVVAVIFLARVIGHFESLK